MGKGAYGYVLGCVHRESKKRFACKTIDVKALLTTRDGPNILGRLKNEIAGACCPEKNKPEAGPLAHAPVSWRCVHVRTPMGPSTP